MNVIRIFGPWLVLAAVQIGGPLHAQTPLHTLQGVVRDTAGGAIQGAEVLLHSPKLSTFTDAAGRFRFDSVPAGSRRLTVRRIGYLVVHPQVNVPQAPGDTLRVTTIPAPQLLQPIVVEAERRGIRGVVGDTAYRPVRGALIEILGSQSADTTDQSGHFAFEGLKDGHYVIRVSHADYFGQVISVNLTKAGKEYSVLLTPYRPGVFDWVNTNAGIVALNDLSTRLAVESRQKRMTAEELARYGSMPLCQIPRLRAVLKNPTILVRGAIWFRRDQTGDEDSVNGLCAWNADQAELLEWGEEPCKESAKTIANALTLSCGVVRAPRNRPAGGGPGPNGPWISIWPKG